MTDRYDVAVAGGGMVGATCALALARQGMRVVVIEARAPRLTWPADSFDLRVSAITRTSRHVFANLGVWGAMADMRVTPYRHMFVWEQDPGRGLHFDAEHCGTADLGHIVENRVILRALWSGLADAGVSVEAPAEVQAIEFGGDGVAIDLADGRRLTAALLVGADGAGSRVRELAGIDTSGHSYQQHAVVATVRPEQGHEQTAWQRFLPGGPLALLPLGAAHCSIVWSTDEAQASALLAADDAAFGASLTDATQRRLGPIEVSGPRGRFPLRLQRAVRYVLPGLALIGDAAHVVHPLAGQGVNLGVLDAAVLAEQLGTARAAGRPLGAMAVLRRYERARKTDNLVVQYSMDGIKQLFGSGGEPLARVRDLGMRMIDASPWLKGLMTDAAQGRWSEAPALTRRPHG